MSNMRWRGLVVTLIGAACACSGTIGDAAKNTGPTTTSGSSGGQPTSSGGSPVQDQTGGTGVASTSVPPDGGGDAATAMAAPHVVSPCPSNGDSAGQWELISPPQVPSDAQYMSVAVDPHDPATVYTGAGSPNAGKTYGIWKSTDCGATWAKLDTGRNSSAIDTGFQWQIQVDPTNPSTLWASNGYGSPACIFKSTDGGVDWDPAWGTSVSQNLTYNFGQGFDLDPTNPQHIVVTFHENCVGTYAPMCMGESNDGGATWRVFEGPTNMWEEAGQVTVFGAKTFLYAAPFTGLYYTQDDGATWQTVFNDALGLAYKASTGNNMFIGTQQHGSLMSTDGGHTWSEIPNSPLATSFVDDGTYLYSTFQFNTAGQPFNSALLAMPTKWTTMKSPTITGGGTFLQYDPDHHIVYSNNYGQGLWRLVTH